MGSSYSGRASYGFFFLVVLLKGWKNEWKREGGNYVIDVYIYSVQAPRPACRAPRDPTPAPQVLPRLWRSVPAPRASATPPAHSQCLALGNFKSLTAVVVTDA